MDTMIADFDPIALVTAVLGGIALILTAVAAIVTAARIKRIDTKTDAIPVIHAQTTAIDNAVNGKPPGAPTISEEVTEIAAEMKGVELPGGST